MIFECSRVHLRLYNIYANCRESSPMRSLFNTRLRNQLPSSTHYGIVIEIICMLCIRVLHCRDTPASLTNRFVGTSQ